MPRRKAARDEGTMPVTIWHNPRCSTSRRVLEMIRNKGIEPHVVEYLKTPPSAKELKAVLAKLKIGARDLLRKKEPDYKKHGLDDEKVSEAALIRAMTDNPVLIERPVVLAGRRAVLARPPERVFEVI
jgi:arsenate reductase